MNGNLANAVEEILKCLGVKSKINSVDVLPAQGGVHDDGRERMSDGVSCHAIDASRCVHLLDAVDAAELLSTDLAGRGFLIFTNSCERKDAAGAHSKHTTDDALLSHAQADQRVFVALSLEELHHCYVVGERGGSGDNLV